MPKIGRKLADLEVLEGGGAGGMGGGGKRSSAPSTREVLVNIGAPGAVAGGAALGGSVYAGKKADERAKTEREAKGELKRESRGIKDESARHYKGMANSTKQK